MVISNGNEKLHKNNFKFFRTNIFFFEKLEKLLIFGKF